MNRLTILLLIATLNVQLTYGQNKDSMFNRGLIVKTNLTNLFARKPAFSIESFFSNSFSCELSFVQGKFRNILLADNYEYEGLLLRAKKYLHPIESAKLSPFAGFYAGTLKRDIQRDSYVDNTGFVSLPGKDFSANSVRAGASLGFSFYTKKNFIFDLQTSLGAGRYFNIERSDKASNAKGYLDAQFWMSVGYRL